MAPFLSPTTPHHSTQNNRPSSPNYFALRIDPSASTVKSTASAAPKTSWTPSTSQVFTTAAASPQKILANNSDYEAFLRQTEENRITLGRNSLRSQNLSPSPPDTQITSKNHSHVKPGSSTPSKAPPSLPLSKCETLANDEGVHQSRSPKRLLSTDSANVFTEPRRHSPADFNDTASCRSLGSPTRRHDDRPMRLSLPTQTVAPPREPAHQRSETVPGTLDPSLPSLVSPTRAIEIFTSPNDKSLLLDLRVSTQYAQARIHGALNLCIPTTLLKRTSYNVSRLADTFHDEAQKAKFSSWRSCSNIIVYDSASSQLKEASMCVNILKKFASEGWSGESLIIRGGFAEAAEQCPEAIDNSASGGPRNHNINLASRSEGTNLPPVMGGCPMPVTDNAANPFFGNIRQNMDLMDGVGQISIQLPASLKERDRYEFPEWLRKAVRDRDQGKAVSEKFLRIEKREQKRMQQALAGDAKCHSPSVGPVQQVQIAGVEKGTKNRYNNIFPYEHSRVRLNGVSSDGCDYVNANFLRTSLSYKNYVATQGPIPATFNDFWNMVWQRDIRVIVMLTAETEGGQIKAHNYWKEKRYGQVRLNFHSEHKVSLEGSRIQHPKERADLMPKRRSSHMDQVKQSDASSASSGSSSGAKDDLPGVLVRKFTMSHDEYPFERMREITHLQYSYWPDFGAPAHPSHLLGLVDQCNGVARATSAGPREDPEPASDRPVLVHCSAGCGRTGTFCTVDTVIDILKRQRRHRYQPRQPTPMDEDIPHPRGGSNDRKSPRETSGAGRSSGTMNFKKNTVDGEWLDKDDLDLIETIVEEFRVQRLSVVQSLRQFVLCYETVLEWIAQQGQPKTA